LAAQPRTRVSAKWAREIAWSVAALACFGQEAGNGMEKVEVGMEETGTVERLCSKG